MKLLYRRCAALDVHKKTVCACIRQVCAHGQVEILRETFGTFTDDLEHLRDWLREHKVRRVAMESTGVYWIPVWNVLEPKQYGLELLLVNPALVKALPGRKTDAKDAARIAELHQYGLLRGSFIPPKPIRKIRDLVRRRTQLQRDRNRVTNRITRLLECANVKLGSVASNIVGVSGRKMLRAMARGEGNPQRWAAMALGKLKEKEAELVRALNGRFNDHFRYLLTDLLTDFDYIEAKVETVERHIQHEFAGHEDAINRLRTIPGVDTLTAWMIVSEIGWDMSRFPTAEQLANWAGLCPGSNESGGKRLSGRTHKGNRYLRRGLIQVAWAIARSKDGNFLTALFFRIARRRGLKKAAVAVAHRVILIAYDILRNGSVYRELGGDYFDRLHPGRTSRRLIARLKQLGLEVEVRPRSTGVGGPPAEPTARARPPRPTRVKEGAGTRPDDATICSTCRRWGITCIHANPRISDHPRRPSPPESAG